MPDAPFLNGGRRWLLAGSLVGLGACATPPVADPLAVDVPASASIPAADATRHPYANTTRTPTDESTLDIESASVVAPVKSTTDLASDNATVATARPRPLPASMAASIATSTTDLQERDVGRAFAWARTRLERDSGVDLSGIALRVVDDPAMVEEVGLETRRLVEGRLGEGDLSHRLLDTLLVGQGGTYAALYAGRVQTVLVSRDVLAGYLASVPAGQGRRDQALRVLMLHELVHATDDLRYGIHANRTLDFRASFAQSAAYEGHAQWQTREICRQAGCLAGLDSLDAFMFGPHDDTGTDAAAQLERNLLEYSYVEGERFIAGIAARPNGNQLLEALLTDPPHDPLQILDPASYPDGARERRNRALLATAESIRHPWLDEDGAERRVGIETSPLKGVNLRDDPARRRAAVDGFTRLVTAMAAIQFHDPEATRLSPIEVTLMQTDTVRTAELFAGTLQAHAEIDGSRSSEAIVGEASDGSARTLLRTASPGPDGRTWFTAIATAGSFVVQASGRDATAASMDAYVLDVLAALLIAPS